ncbi:MAG: hypothetical protein U9R48_07525 [Chloroflexota bacterium]|nr:hypothetical protein [Chloroflexota bacterium]
MNRKTRLHPLMIISILIAVVVLSAGCTEQERNESFIYVDGTRGCKQAPVPVTLWQEAGAAAVGSEAIGEVPHGIRLSVLDTSSRFGITFYLVEYEGQAGWIPVNFTESVEPICE